VIERHEALGLLAIAMLIAAGLIMIWLVWRDR
jgi:hypothetical protein